MKRIISAILIYCLILPFLPASAAEEAVAQPSIEEILNEYHEKAFETQAATENGGASTYARGGSSQTLEQETVEALTDAGYEAYNVTGENYEALEESLKTDFAEMGLNPESSYVVVVSGEDPAAQSNPNARVLPPAYDDFDGNTSGSCYTFSYGGRSYTMRRILVTAAEDPKYATCNEVNLVDLLDGSSAFSDLLQRLLNYTISSAIDKETDSSLGTVLDLFGIEFVDIDPSKNCILNFYAGLSRIRSYTQIYEPVTQEWESWYSAEAATLTTRYSGMYYNHTLKRFTTINQPENVYSLNSDYYFNYTLQSEQAVLNQAIPRITFDHIGTVEILLKDENTGRQIHILSFAPYIGVTP